MLHFNAQYVTKFPIISASILQYVSNVKISSTLLKMAKISESFKYTENFLAKYCKFTGSNCNIRENIAEKLPEIAKSKFMVLLSRY